MDKNWTTWNTQAMQALDRGDIEQAERAFRLACPLRVVSAMQTGNNHGTIQWRNALRFVIARLQRGRGALSAKREEVPLGCNLGKAVTISPIVFL